MTGEHWRGSKSSAASLSCPENDEDDDDAFDNDDSDADNGDRLGYSFADQIQRKSQNPLGRLYPPPKMRPRQNNIRNDSRLLHFHAKQYWTENYAAIGIGRVSFFILC